MEFINSSDIQNALQFVNRVYLCGDLQKPQNLQWIHDAKNEVGMSYYRQFTADKPHYHTTATEYNFIISGETKVFLIDEGREFLFKAESIFVLPPLTKYASKHLANTKILFFKSPGGNDKKLIDIDSRLEEWLKNW